MLKTPEIHDKPRPDHSQFCSEPTWTHFSFNLTRISWFIKTIIWGPGQILDSVWCHSVFLRSWSRFCPRRAVAAGSCATTAPSRPPGAAGPSCTRAASPTTTKGCPPPPACATSQWPLWTHERNAVLEPRGSDPNREPVLWAERLERHTGSSWTLCCFAESWGLYHDRVKRTLWNFVQNNQRGNEDFLTFSSQSFSRFLFKVTKFLFAHKNNVFFKWIKEFGLPVVPLTDRQAPI